MTHAHAAGRPPSPSGVALVADDELPSGAEKTALVRSMFDTIAPRYDLVNRVMTFGLDVRWRRQSVRALGLAAGSRVLDLACGTGDFLSIGSAGSILSIGSAGSILSIGSSGSVLSIGSAGSFAPKASIRSRCCARAGR